MQGLRALGSSPDRLDILLTHLHSDHTGLAREAAGADSRIYISGIDLTILKDGLHRSARFGWRLNSVPVDFRRMK